MAVTDYTVGRCLLISNITNKFNLKILNNSKKNKTKSQQLETWGS